MPTTQFGDEIGSEMETIVTPDDDFETIGRSDDEAGLDYVGEVNFSEADFRVAHGWCGGLDDVVDMTRLLTDQSATRCRSVSPWSYPM